MVGDLMRRKRKLLIAVLAVLAGLLVANTLVTNAEVKPARAEDGRLLRLPGGDLHVVERGPRKGPPLVLLHGYTASVRWWERVMAPLSRSHRVVALDLLGHGASEKPRDGYSIPAQARVVAQALERLDVRDATVVGHSMGANVAIALAEEDRGAVDRIVMLDGGGRRKYSNDSALARLARAPVIGQLLRRLTTKGAAKRGIAIGFAKDFEVPDRLAEDLGRMTFSSFKQAREASFDYAKESPPDVRAAALRLPLLVAFGNGDRLTSPRAIREYRDVSRARTTLIRGSGHSPQVEKPRDTARLILRFAR